MPSTVRPWLGFLPRLLCSSSPRTKGFVAWPLTTVHLLQDAQEPLFPPQMCLFFCSAHLDPIIEDCSNSPSLQPCHFFLLLTSWNFIPELQISISFPIEQKLQLIPIYRASHGQRQAQSNNCLMRIKKQPFSTEFRANSDPLGSIMVKLQELTHIVRE